LAENSGKQINAEKASYLKSPYPWSCRTVEAEGSNEKAQHQKRWACTSLTSWLTLRKSLNLSEA